MPQQLYVLKVIFPTKPPGIELRTGQQNHGMRVVAILERLSDPGCPVQVLQGHVHSAPFLPTKHHQGSCKKRQNCLKGSIIRWSIFPSLQKKVYSGNIDKPSSLLADYKFLIIKMYIINLCKGINDGWEMVDGWLRVT